MKRFSGLNVKFTFANRSKNEVSLIKLPQRVTLRAPALGRAQDDTRILLLHEGPGTFWPVCSGKFRVKNLRNLLNPFNLRFRQKLRFIHSQNQFLQRFHNYQLGLSVRFFSFLQ